MLINEYWTQFPQNVATYLEALPDCAFAKMDDMCMPSMNKDIGVRLRDKLWTREENELD